MQITTLLGSARKKGNTATVLGWVEEELKSMDHDVERIYLNNKSIGGCLGCDKCGENPDEIACVQKDDAIDIMEKMIASGAILYASPIYFWGFSAQIKALIDRGYALVTNYHKPGWTSLLEGKHIGLANQAEWGGDIDRLKPRFSSDALLTLRGCNVGRGPEGRELVDLLHEKLGVKVRAPTGPTTPLWIFGRWTKAP